MQYFHIPAPSRPLSFLSFRHPRINVSRRGNPLKRLRHMPSTVLASAWLSGTRSGDLASLSHRKSTGVEHQSFSKKNPPRPGTARRHHRELARPPESSAYGNNPTLPRSAPVPPRMPTRPVPLRLHDHSSPSRQRHLSAQCCGDVLLLRVRQYALLWTKPFAIVTMTILMSRPNDQLRR